MVPGSKASPLTGLRRTDLAETIKDAQSAKKASALEGAIVGVRSDVSERDKPVTVEKYLLGDKIYHARQSIGARVDSGPFDRELMELTQASSIGSVRAPGGSSSSTNLYNQLVTINSLLQDLDEACKSDVLMSEAEQPGALTKELQQAALKRQAELTKAMSQLLERLSSHSKYVVNTVSDGDVVRLGQKVVNALGLFSSSNPALSRCEDIVTESLTEIATQLSDVSESLVSDTINVFMHQRDNTFLSEVTYRSMLRSAPNFLLDNTDDNIPDVPTNGPVTSAIRGNGAEDQPGFVPLSDPVPSPKEPKSRFVPLSPQVPSPREPSGRPALPPEDYPDNGTLASMSNQAAHSLDPGVETQGNVGAGAEDGEGASARPPSSGTGSEVNYYEGDTYNITFNMPDPIDTPPEPVIGDLINLNDDDMVFVPIHYPVDSGYVYDYAPQETDQAENSSTSEQLPDNQEPVQDHSVIIANNPFIAHSFVQAEMQETGELDSSADEESNAGSDNSSESQASSSMRVQGTQDDGRGSSDNQANTGSAGQFGGNSDDSDDSEDKNGTRIERVSLGTQTEPEETEPSTIIYQHFYHTHPHSHNIIVLPHDHSEAPTSVPEPTPTPFTVTATHPVNKILSFVSVSTVKKPLYTSHLTFPKPQKGPIQAILSKTTGNWDKAQSGGWVERGKTAVLNPVKPEVKPPVPLSTSQRSLNMGKGIIPKEEVTLGNIRLKDTEKPDMYQSHELLDQLYAAKDIDNREERYEMIDDTLGKMIGGAKFTKQGGVSEKEDKLPNLYEKIHKALMKHLVETGEEYKCALYPLIEKSTEWHKEIASIYNEFLNIYHPPQSPSEQPSTAMLGTMILKQHIRSSLNMDTFRAPISARSSASLPPLPESPEPTEPPESSSVRDIRKKFSGK